MADIYQTDFVEQLFDEMSASYERVNYLTSFGFSKRWRTQFVRQLALKPDMVICDLMCGMGECWDTVAVELGHRGHLLALDVSAGMLKGAEKRKAKFPHLNITLLKQDALLNTLEDGCVDGIVCGFGLKTFSEDQKAQLAAEIKRILKPRGMFSLIEVSVPSGWLFKGLYMFYLKEIIPLLGRILLGNPDNYRMLGIYTEKFGDCRTMQNLLVQQGLQVTYHRYFYGCASGVSGVKI
jgi:demethylmenaquinone methyltransferase/2-methoxy-6-polyprenyl-1,4-benzoquinol methylase